MSHTLPQRTSLMSAPRSLMAVQPKPFGVSHHARVMPHANRAGSLASSVLPRLLRLSTRAAVETAEKTSKDSSQEEEEEFDDLDSAEDATALTTHQVHQLLNVVCDETEIAEIELKLGGFSLKMRRKSTDDAFTQAAQPYSANGASFTPSSANELPFQSTASMDESQILSPPVSNGSVSSVDEEDWKQENLLYIGAPKVGILRRGRYIKGKKVGKGPVAEVGTKVKKGQPLGFIEQLGTFVPIEAPQAGEIVSYTVDEGKAVEYKEVILEIAPFFGGHIIGDKKYA